ncbi:winged helix-turn-helix transcriptional regulator [Actinomadura rudentiformis]|uniref:Helix-turn-helix transcriptional regulator n=1 Tax=Actinomadura rudentiformis TaxID=359158 RepID=A0A6H9Z9G1_9ACTN|nr:winged helix-turn-helix transcriptional regulator [Actinomadura rudentiformis]KAB2352315.1 helix-turn-helix transcriptional regulator [Actinomadura rudentiformis]
MLSAKPQTLVRDGLITRTVEPTTPPQVTYELTDMGHVLSRPFAQLIRAIADGGDRPFPRRWRLFAGLHGAWPASFHIATRAPTCLISAIR